MKDLTESNCISREPELDCAATCCCAAQWAAETIWTSAEHNSDLAPRIRAQRRFSSEDKLWSKATLDARRDPHVVIVRYSRRGRCGAIAKDCHRDLKSLIEGSDAWLWAGTRPREQRTWAMTRRVNPQVVSFSPSVRKSLLLLLLFFDCVKGYSFKPTCRSMRNCTLLLKAICNILLWTPQIHESFSNRSSDTRFTANDTVTFDLLTTNHRSLTAFHCTFIFSC